MESNISELILRNPQLEGQEKNINEALELLISAAQKKKIILVAGNGGSSADADHIVGELMKSFLLKRTLDSSTKTKLKAISPMGEEIAAGLQGAIAAINLSAHTSLTSAFSNDVNYDLVFAQQTLGYGKEDGVFWGFSTSGNSLNVVNGALVAKAMGMKVLGMTGLHGGQLKTFCDVCIQVPETETFRIQELQQPIYHFLCLEVEKALFG
ncbi:MAG: SIS domain-containing protein [Sphaerochaetaceae bacterium]